MEILSQQRFVSTRINLLRNYCKIEDKKRYVNAGRFTDVFSDDKTMVGLELTIMKGMKRNARFFSQPIDDVRDAGEGAYFERVISCDTLDDEKVKRYYNNPFAEVSVMIFERSVIKRGNKITITSSTYSKRRMYNCRYFKSHTNKNIFTFNFDTGNFQVISISGAGKKSRLFRTNNFRHLSNVLIHGPGIFKLEYWNPCGNNNKYKYESEFKKAINEEEYHKVLADVFDLEPYHLAKSNNHKAFYEKINELFVKHKKIGVPDHSYHHFIRDHYPTERYLKKNGRKLIASVLDKYKIKSKLLIKIFHKYPYLDIAAMVKLCVILGDDHTKYIGSLPESLFLLSDKYSAESIEPDFYGSFYNRMAHFNVKEIEKENMIKLLSDKESTRALANDYLDEIYDHFNMIDKVRKYDENLMFRARNYAEFRDEHRELGKMVNAIRKGWVTQYIFEDKTVREIEAPIDSFKPCILKREEEYVEEGSFMHHCVASYVDHDKSLIVSIRNEDASDRITCEFNIQTGKMIQARHFCNKQVPEEFESALEILQDKIRLHARYGTLNWKEKKKVAFQINGIDVKQEGPRLAGDLYQMLAQ